MRGNGKMAMNLSVVIPAHNEEEGVRPTVERLYGTLMEAHIPFEILVVNDHSTDSTEQVLQRLAHDLPGVRYVNNLKPGGFGRAIQTGLERFRGDAVCIVMADASDDPKDVVAYYRKLEEGYECVFGSRFLRESRVVDYPTHKLLINRMANWFINVLFQLHFNDTTNAFKAYRREVIDGVKPFLSSHFNITVELPLKAITRGYTYATVPINWYNRATGVSKLKIKEMGSRYLFIVLYVWLERLLSQGDYYRPVWTPNTVNVVRELTDALLEETVPRHAALTARTATSPAGSTALATRPISRSSQTVPASDAPNEDSSLTQGTRGKTLAWLAGILCIAPLLLIGFILTMIWTHTPHVPYWDEWDHAVLLEHFTQGTLTWNDFWAFHNEHRIVIPQMLDLGIILATHWNRQVEMTFDLLLAAAECGFLVTSAYRGLRSKVLTALAIAPMALAIFSLTQYEDWLWAYQITFILTVFGVALCVWGLTWPRAGWGAFVVTLVGAVTAALSSLGGLAVFVAFIPAVFSQGHKKTLVWFAVAAAVIVPYMRGFPHSVPISISLVTLKFCITYLGAPVGAPSPKLSFLAGLVSLALAVANVAYYWVREKRIAPLLPWIGLGGYAIGLALITSFGRISLGYWYTIALTSRYQVFAVTWWVTVIYLLLLNAKRLYAHRARHSSTASIVERLSPWLLGANALVLVALTVGLAAASWQKIPDMETYQYPQLHAEACVVNDHYATMPCLWNFYPAPIELQARVDFVRSQHDAIFAEGYQQLEQPVPDPSRHALVRYYDAGFSDYMVTTTYNLNAYGPYYTQAVLGYVYDQKQPGTHALYTCTTSDGHHFSSLNATCPGGTYMRTEGWLLNTPLAAGLAGSAVSLYDCQSGVADFVSTQASCNGQSATSTLGNALTSQN